MKILNLLTDLRKSPGQQKLPENLLQGFEKLHWSEDDGTQSNTLDNYFKSVDISEFNGDGIHKKLMDAEEKDDQMDRSFGGTMSDEEEFADIAPASQAPTRLDVRSENATQP